METNSALLITTGALGGALITSWIGPYLTQGRERRQIRAQALQALMEVEQNRWHDTSYASFKSALIKLKSAALIARADRNLTEYYCYLAEVGYSTSLRDAENEPNVPLEYKGGIAQDLEDLIVDAAWALSDTLWHPLKSHFGKSQFLDDLKRRQQSVQRSLNRKGVTVNWRARGTKTKI